MSTYVTDRGVTARHAGRVEPWIDARAAINRNGGRMPRGRHAPTRTRPARVRVNRRHVSRIEHMRSAIVRLIRTGSTVTPARHAAYALAA